MSITAEKLNTSVLRLHQILASFSSSSSQSEESTSELVDFLCTSSDSVASEPENEESENTVFEILTEIHTYVSSPSLDQAVMDALSFELPKAVARFSSASKRCMDVSESVIDRFVACCSPRDMLSILCELLYPTINALGRELAKKEPPKYLTA